MLVVIFLWLILLGLFTAGIVLLILGLTKGDKKLRNIGIILLIVPVVFIILPLLLYLIPVSIS